MCYIDIDSYNVNKKWLSSNTISNTGNYNEKFPFIISPDPSTKPSTYQKMLSISGPLLSLSGVGYSCTKANI